MPTNAFLSDLSRTACLTLAFAACACSSSGDAEQKIPEPKMTATGGTGGKGTGGATTGGSGGATTGGGSGTGSGMGGSGGMSGSAGSDGLEPIDLPWLHTEGNAIKDANGNTVVLRGVAMIDLPVTQLREGGVNAMIDRLTKQDDAQGSSPGWATKVVRFAVSPADFDQGSPEVYQPGGTYYEKYLRPAVDHAKEKGVYAIIDWHYVEQPSTHHDTTIAFWSDIAPRFAGDSNVIFELFNEPDNKDTWATVKTEMQAYYDTVRAGAPENLVLVGTPNWCQLVGTAAQDPITATNVAYVAHMYPEHWKQPSLQAQITTAAMLVPVFMTEWGFQETSMTALLQGTVTTYGNPLKQFVNDRGLSWTAWCASNSWGPPMFANDMSLRVGEGEMGGFAKDWLYEKKDADLPQP